MASNIPLPALAIQPPAPQPGPMDQYGKLMQLKSLLNQQNLQQSQLAGEQQRQQQSAALFPGQQQQQNIQTQMAQGKLASQQAMMKAWSDPDFIKEVGGSSGSSTSGGTSQGAASSGPGFDPNAMMQSLVKRGVLPEDASAMTNGFVDRSAKVSETIKNNAGATADQISTYKKAVDDVTSHLSSIMDMPASKAGPALDAYKQQLAQSPLPGLGPQEMQMIQSANLDKLPAFVNLAQLESNIAQFHQKEAEAQSAQASATKSKMELPGGAMNPVTQAVQEARLKQPIEIATQQKEEQSRQAIMQGDPDTAGQLLANRSLTLQEMKTRGSTPQFIASAVKSAQNIDPTFKAAESEAQSKIAGSTANQQFFGNTDSLLVKGGTLDQLEARGAALGSTKIPAYNSLANWTKAALGSGPQAAYAASVLGVADDYSKVMTGGQGSDTSRQQALNIISKNLSPEGRAAAVQQIRDQVNSQRQGRIGTNPYMHDMYPHPNPTASATQQQQTQPRAAAGMTRIKASDGTLHDVPTANLAGARKIDPNLQVIQ